MSQVKRPPMLRYGVAVLLVALAAIVTSQVSPLYTRSPFSLFFAVVILISAYGGFGEALLAIILSALVGTYLFLPPTHSLSIGTDGVLRLSTFTLLTLLLNFLTHKLKRAEMSARVSEQQLSTTLMSIGDAVIATDTAGRVTFMNVAAQTLTGWMLGEARGQQLEAVFRIVNEETRLEVENPVVKVLREGIVVGLANHTILHARDGREIPVDDSGAPIRDEEGNINGVVLVFRDVSELKQADEKLRFQAHLLDVVEQAMIATDMEGKITYWNQFAEKLYGWTAEEVRGRNIIEITPDAAAREQADEIMSAMLAGESWAGEFSAHHRNGTVFPIRVNNSPVYDESGKQIGIVGSSDDISNEKRAEAERARLLTEIEQQRVRLNNLITSVPGVVWEAWGAPDAATQRIDFVSDYVEAMLGYSVEEWLATPNFWLGIVHPDDKERAAREAADKFAKGQGTSQFRWVAKDGRVLWAEAHSVAVYDDEGKPIGMRGVTLDISVRKQAEEALRRSERELSDFFENAAVSLHWVGSDGIILRANRTELNLLGYSQEEYIGHHIAEFHVDEPVIKDILTCLVQGETLHEYEARLRCKDGTIKHVLIDSNVLWEDGKFVHTRCFTRDITERKLAEERQAELLAREHAARTEAELANRTKDEFLATLSHELRTPLTAMLGWTWMMRSRELDQETYNHALETIERNVRAQAQLIEDLLDVSRIITGKIRLDVGPSELVPVIEAALDTVRPAAGAKGIQLQAELDPEASRVLCDPARMQQVVWNLLSNAVKFTPGHGTVKVSLKRVESHVEIGVRDTGQGIGRDFLPHVFDRFRQADSSTTRTHGGLGLGLAIVRHLVELHGGTVNVESEGEGAGASFTVRLPLMTRSAGTSEADTHGYAETEGGREPDCPPSLDGVHVLIVDDEPDARDLLSAALKHCDARVTAVSSANEALDALKQVPPDVLVSDIGMPGADGYELIKKVRALEGENGEPQIPAIALTAYASDSARATALNAGFQKHLAKPIEPSALVETIAGLVKKKETEELP